MHFYRINFSYLILFKHDESLKLKLARALILINSFASAHPSCSKEAGYILLAVNDLVSVLLFLFVAENTENMFSVVTVFKEFPNKGFGVQRSDLVWISCRTHLSSLAAREKQFG